ncbi:hypothetical protein LO772_18925 [Yinghuangia sp. ASG 101]|uniref:DUF7507 domain-containing protein n=1 Tax=Yinghuangia sp. ASG 101 TaxID=2896848 RepID=UPI001E4CB62E|nr:hypothetical protein [Yinghuangia sp. ASG 101]UGQ09045.1 hypothetical protein LO772_18925 [Yinghuangia sp. ASG 101]
MPLLHATVATSATRAAAPPLLRETFTGATADAGFTAVGPACLTGAAPGAAPGPGAHALTGCAEPAVGPVPPNNGAPFGYLRLTDASTDQSAAVLYDRPLPANEGLEVTFDQWQYGSTTPQTPADGISFFLVDGAASLTAPGAFGGSLGYAQKLPDDNPANPFLPGVDHGYLGVGLDVLGNYFGDWEHRGNGCPVRSPAGTEFRVPAPGANMVTVRGPGDGTTGYCFLTATTDNFTTTGPWNSTLPGQLQGPTTALPPDATPEQAQAALEESRRTVTVRVTPAPNPVVTVDVDFNDGRGAQRVLTTDAPQPLPSTYKFGFGGSTGLFTDVHLIRNVSVQPLRPLPQLNLVKQVSQSPPPPSPIVVGTPIDYEFVVSNTGSVPIGELVVSDPTVGPVHCPTRDLAPGETITCTATYVVTAEDVARGYLANEAVAQGQADGTPVTSPPADTTVPMGGLALVKTVDDTRTYAVGDTVSYQYVVTNTTDRRVDGLVVTDDRIAGITCESTSLAPHGTPGDSTVCGGTYTVTEADVQAGTVRNQATATAGDLSSPPAHAAVTTEGPCPTVTATETATATVTATATKTTTATATVTATETATATATVTATETTTVTATPSKHPTGKPEPSHTTGHTGTHKPGTTTGSGHGDHKPSETEDTTAPPPWAAGPAADAADDSRADGPTPNTGVLAQTGSTAAILCGTALALLILGSTLYLRARKRRD